MFLPRSIITLGHLNQKSQEKWTGPVWNIGCHEMPQTGDIKKQVFSQTFLSSLLRRCCVCVAQTAAVYLPMGPTFKQSMVSLLSIGIIGGFSAIQELCSLSFPLLRQKILKLTMQMVTHIE